MRSITYPEARYLKHVGAKSDVKVSIRIVENKPMIFIRDFEFTGYPKALVCLQHIVETEVIEKADD